MRKTKTREQILEVLNKNKKAFTAKDIHAQLDGPDLATVYRNLNLFAEEGIVRELRINRGESMYEINEDDHEHAICSKCGKVRHISVDKNKLKELLNLSDFEVENVEINFVGYCK
jgi:Fe2+ or Zn2+ uptake regulation protein